jgi:hypothetical protein
MVNEEQLRVLMSIWKTESDGFEAEARRLESSDQSRHATSTEMLETRTQAIDRCILELETLNQVGSASKG